MTSKIGDSASVHLPCATSSISEAGHELAAFLAAHAVEEMTVREAAHVLGELIANAVKHGRPDARCTVAASWAVVESGDEDELVLTVEDSGTPDDGQVIEKHPPTPHAAHGRGLLMVEALSDRWQAHRDHRGTRVTAWLRLPAATTVAAGQPH